MAKAKLPKTEKELKALLKETNKLLAANDKEYYRLEKVQEDVEEALYELEVNRNQ